MGKPELKSGDRIPGLKNMIRRAPDSRGGSSTYGNVACDPPEVHSVLTYGAIIVGGILLVVGLFQYIADEAKGPEARMATSMDAAVITILQAMLAVAAADGEIHEEEVATIRSIFKHLIGPDLDANVIRQTGQEMIADEFDIIEKLAERQKVIPTETKPDILRAVMSVAGAHGNPSENEASLIVGIAQALGLPGDDITNIIREFQH